MTIFDDIKNNGEDFEFYPTTETMLNRVISDIIVFKRGMRILDIGAGDCRLYNLIKEEKPTYLAIEKSKTLIQKMDKDILVVGSDFHQTTLYDKNVDMVFCNPPYSEFETWMSRILNEVPASNFYFVVPERWKKNPAINETVKKQNFSTRILYEGSFNVADADRKARCNIEIIKFSKSVYKISDYFSDWFDSNFSFEKTEEKQEEEETKDNGLCLNKGIVEHFIEDYNKEMLSVQNTLQSIKNMSKGVRDILGVDETKIKVLLKEHITETKIKYWKRIFDYIPEIKKKLTRKNRNLMFEKLQNTNSIDFSYDNVYSIIIWVLKNADSMISEQIGDFFYNISSKECVKPYKSNQKLFEKDGWKWNKYEKTHYALDYRIIVPFHNSYLFEYNLEMKFEDWVTIAENLGFSIGEVQIPKKVISGQKHYIYKSDGSIMFEYKLFQNGNMHIKCDVEFTKALNIQVAKIFGWIKDKSDIVKELGIEYKGSEDYFDIKNTLKIGGVGE